MSKYGDDHVCTCEMNYVSCNNAHHADDCELWLEPSFKDGTDEWDGDMGCLMLSQSPWRNPDDYVWDGDNPIIRKSTAFNRELEEAIEVAQAELIEEEDLCPLEAEAIAAFEVGGSPVAEADWVMLPDGSFADFESRITFRKITDDDGAPAWVEERWDDDINLYDDEEKVYECTCAAVKLYYCHQCKLQRDTKDSPWVPWEPYKADCVTSTTYESSYTFTPKCSHCFETFKLPKRQHENIKISASRMHTAETMPDQGLYAYNGWNPKCVATFLPWQDYGLPTVPFKTAAETIVTAYKMACDGKVVEVGCMGGHGRTGTILACMAILSDPEMTPMGAVKWVRKVHCNEAVETNQQEWFVAWFKAWYLGETPPPMPETYVSKHSANWQAAGKAAEAVKAGATPLVVPTPESPAVGTPTSSPAWCSGCQRVVYTMHNNDCPLDVATPVLEFDPALYAKGETANARRRNAKRANRRAAQKRHKENSR